MALDIAEMGVKKKIVVLLFDHYYCLKSSRFLDCCNNNFYCLIPFRLIIYSTLLSWSCSMKTRPFFYCLDLLLFFYFVDSENIKQVDGLGRNAVMYCIHGHSPEHDECLEVLIKANADLNHQAHGKNFLKILHRSLYA